MLRIRTGEGYVEEPNHRHRRLLRARRERPRCRVPPSSVMNSRRFIGSLFQAEDKILSDWSAERAFCIAVKWEANVRVGHFDCLAHQPQAHPTSAASLIAAVLSMDGRSSVSANSEPEQMQQIIY